MWFSYRRWKFFYAFTAFRNLSWSLTQYSYELRPHQFQFIKIFSSRWNQRLIINEPMLNFPLKPAWNTASIDFTRQLYATFRVWNSRQILKSKACTPKILNFFFGWDLIEDTIFRARSVRTIFSKSCLIETKWR